jgi:hypothetical protein
VCEVIFVAISEVAADRKSIELISAYFDLQFSEMCRDEIIIDIVSVEGETREPIADAIHRSVQKYKITENALDLWEGNNITDPSVTPRRGNSNT